MEIVEQSSVVAKGRVAFPTGVTWAALSFVGPLGDSDGWDYAFGLEVRGESPEQARKTMKGALKDLKAAITAIEKGAGL